MRLARLALVGCLLLNACAYFRPRTPAEPEAVDFTAMTEFIAPGDSVMRVRVVASNSGSLTWTLELGPCSMNIRMAALSASPMREWDLERWRIAVNPKAACVGYRAPYVLAPGGTVASSELERVVRVRDVLGDSLPTGRYRVTVSISFSNQPPTQVAAGEVELRGNQ